MPQTTKADIQAAEVAQAARRQAWNAPHLEAITAILDDDDFIAKMASVETAANELIGGPAAAIRNLPRQCEQVRKLLAALKQQEAANG